LQRLSGRFPPPLADELLGRFQGAVCLTTGVIGNPNLLYLSLGINWGVAYDLPNITWVLHNAHGWTTKKSAKAQIKRRHRRELYGRLETMIDR